MAKSQKRSLKECVSRTNAQAAAETLAELAGSGKQGLSIQPSEKSLNQIGPNGRQQSKTSGHKPRSGSTASPKEEAAATSPFPPDNKLELWLNEQATKLNSLEAQGSKLKLDFVRNAKAKGELLAKVHGRLTGMPRRFERWVKEDTDIGYSTAVLWMDVSKHYEAVMKKFDDSNPLELTVTAIRDAIRDARQEQGGGKPGCGKKKATVAQAGDRGPAENDHEVAVTNQVDAPDKRRWEREAAKAEADANIVEGGKKTEAKPSAYKVTVMVFSENDQTTIQQALSNWSPISTTPTGKACRTVSAHVQPTSIVALLEKLGKTLEKNQPEKLRE